MTYEMNTIKTIKKLRKKGYHKDFSFTKGKLFIAEEDKSFEPDEIHIDEEYRFEGMTNPADMSLLYALSARSGEKGLIQVPYGTYGNTDAAKFFLEVEKN